MPLYMIQFAYTPEAKAALARVPEDRSVVFGQVVEDMGGRLNACYNSLGEYDGGAIFEVPEATLDPFRTVSKTDFSETKPIWFMRGMHARDMGSKSRRSSLWSSGVWTRVWTNANLFVRFSAYCYAYCYSRNRWNE